MGRDRTERGRYADRIDPDTVLEVFAAQDDAARPMTATRSGRSYTIIVFNDDNYGLISEKQRDHTGGSFGNQLINPNLVAFAESFGIDGYRPESRTDLQKVLTSAVGDDMALIEVPVE
jgi:Thiamine pyrophosphate-requiring enzymes [acetolactate synthase, pyruvate dehydrogenase (cytochrome), glyoxylate carboligase, phosphonopyruvate decarboxylase]